MEGNKRLMRVIQQMRSEIIKLERENRALRGELKFGGQNRAKWEDRGGEEDQKDETQGLTDSGEEAASSLLALRRNVSADSALTLQEQKGTKQP